MKKLLLVSFMLTASLMANAGVLKVGYKAVKYSPKAVAKVAKTAFKVVF